MTPPRCESCKNYCHGSNGRGVCVIGGNPLPTFATGFCSAHTRKKE